MDKFAHMVGEKVGGVVEGAVKSALGVSDKNKDGKKGGSLSLFGGGDKKNKEKGGIFSSGNDKKPEEKKGGFFSKVFDNDDDKGKPKASGFAGLFSEQEGASAAGGNEEGSGATGGATGGGNEVQFGGSEVPSGGTEGPSGAVNDDLFSDLLDVADEMSTGN